MSASEQCLVDVPEFGAKKENDLPPAVDFDILGIIKRPEF